MVNTEGGVVCNALSYKIGSTNYPFWAIIFTIIMSIQIPTFSYLLWKSSRPGSRTKRQFVYPIYGFTLIGKLFFWNRK